MRQGKARLRKVRTHVFRGGRYKTIWRAPRRSKTDVPGETRFGLCDFERKKLWMFPSKDPYEFLDTVLHETMHANHPDLDEHSVRAGVESQVAFLKRLGMKISFSHE